MSLLCHIFLSLAYLVLFCWISDIQVVPLWVLDVSIPGVSLSFFWDTVRLLGSRSLSLQVLLLSSVRTGAVVSMGWPLLLLRQDPFVYWAPHEARSWLAGGRALFLIAWSPVLLDGSFPGSGGVLTRICWSLLGWAPTGDCRLQRRLCSLLAGVPPFLPVH